MNEGIKIVIIIVLFFIQNLGVTQDTCFTTKPGILNVNWYDDMQFNKQNISDSLAYPFVWNLLPRFFEGDSIIHLQAKTDSSLIFIEGSIEIMNSIPIRLSFTDILSPFDNMVNVKSKCWDFDFALIPGYEWILFYVDEEKGILHLTYVNNYRRALRVQ